MVKAEILVYQENMLHDEIITLYICKHLKKWEVCEIDLLEMVLWYSG